MKPIDSCRFMSSKLSNLVDNLSEINNKDCKTCMERKNIESECEFIGLKNNRLNYKCKECNDEPIFRCKKFVWMGNVSKIIWVYVA